MATSPSGLFKKFNPAESIAQLANTKGSEQRKVRQDLEEQFPNMTAEMWESLMPKKQDIMVVRCHDNVTVITLLPDVANVGNEPQSSTTSIDGSKISKPEVLFFQHFSGKYIPHLRVIHQFPDQLVTNFHQVDIGGCKFVVSGANIMCPGLTSEGGSVGDNVSVGDVVLVYIEGKAHAVAVGIATMSSEDIREKNKGHCIDNVHFLGDGLWVHHTFPAIA